MRQDTCQDVWSTCNPGSGCHLGLSPARGSCGRHECGPGLSVDEGGGCVGKLDFNFKILSPEVMQ